MTEAVVGDLAQFRTAFAYQFRFYLRTYRFIALLALTLILIVAALSLRLYYGVSALTAAGYLSNDLSTLPILLILVAAFLGGDAIAVDFGGANGYYMLVLPVRRRVLLAGRFLAAFSACFVILAVYFAYALGGAIHFYGIASIPPEAASSFLLAVLYLVAALGGAFLFSSFFRSPAISMIATVLILFLGLDIAQGILTVSGVEPWFSLLYAGQAMSSVLNPSFVHQMVIPAGPLRITAWDPYPWEGATIMGGYAALGLAVSWTIYERKETKG